MRQHHLTSPYFRHHTLVLLLALAISNRNDRGI